METRSRSVELLSWDEARAQISSVNKELCKIIDQINPSKKHKLIKATYLYGDLIVNNGVTFLPDRTGKLSPLTSDTIDKKLKNDLTYSHIPLFLTLKGGNEVFLNNGSRIVPLNFFYPGNLLGLFETINALFLKKAFSKWSVSAGARSIFMLPKISEKTAFQRLRKYYNLASTTFPKHMIDHWKVFKEIAQHPNFNQNWSNKVIFFPKSWIQTPKANVEWQLFNNYLFKNAWEQAQFAMNKIEQNLLLESFSEAAALRGYKPTIYIADQIKHILSLISGKVPGFRPAINNIAAPIKGIQESIINVYQLKNYLPTIMHAWPLTTVEKLLPIYYSLNLPTLIEGSPVKKSSNTIMLDLRDIKQLLDTLKNYAKTNDLTSNRIMSNINVEYLHIDKDPYGEIQSSEYIPNDDPAILNDLKCFPNREFCATSLFWRGCLRIKKKATVSE